MSKKVIVQAKPDFIGSLANVRPILALSELIWNSFDANASRVKVSINMNVLDAMDTICIEDDGTGISHINISDLFGNLGDSWKRTAINKGGRSLHGKNGKGRFRAFSLGSDIIWKTVYEANGKKYQYTIIGRRETIESFTVSEPVEVFNIKTGTVVSIENLDRNFTSLINEESTLEIAKQFAPYLAQYPSVKLEYQRILIDPSLVQESTQEYPLNEINLSNGNIFSGSVFIAEWKVPTERKIHLCDNSGISLHETDFQKKIHAPGFNFTVYIKSDYFKQLDLENKLALADLLPDVVTVLSQARKIIKDHFRQRVIEFKSDIITRWKEEKIYPYIDEPQNEAENVERQMFDILAVNVESYLPSFENSDEASKRFTFRLLAQAVKDNPESVQKIITEVLNLKREDQDDLASLLENTSLYNVIKSSQEVANRLNFLTALENILFGEETKEKLLERSQLHKILEKEAWIFQEDFALSSSEERLEDIMAKHLNLMGERVDPVLLPDQRTGRIDLMLSRVNQPRAGEYDYLIVELKRPSKKIDADVITQIKKYAMAVAGDERFHAIPAKWTFIAVSNELDAFAKKEAKQRDRQPGCIYDDSDLNITVWVRTWSEVINNARARLKFINDYLSFKSTKDSSRNYLEKVHKKFIPEYKEKSDEQ